MKTDTYLLLGEEVLLFPYQRSVDNARKYIKTLKMAKVYPKVGHGIETYREAMSTIGQVIKKEYPKT